MMILMLFEVQLFEACCEVTFWRFRRFLTDFGFSFFFPYVMNTKTNLYTNVEEEILDEDIIFESSSSSDEETTKITVDEEYEWDAMWQRGE